MYSTILLKAYVYLINHTLQRIKSNLWIKSFFIQDPLFFQKLLLFIMVYIMVILWEKVYWNQESIIFVFFFYKDLTIM